MSGLDTLRATSLYVASVSACEEATRAYASQESGLSGKLATTAGGNKTGITIWKTTTTFYKIKPTVIHDSTLPAPSIYIRESYTYTHVKTQARMLIAAFYNSHKLEAMEMCFS